jgi:hypothetical protein
MSDDTGKNVDLPGDSRSGDVTRQLNDESPVSDKRARHQVAAALMTAACLLGPAGAWAVWGVGVALLVAAGLLGLVSLLAGWE